MVYTVTGINRNSRDEVLLATTDLTKAEIAGSVIRNTGEYTDITIITWSEDGKRIKFDYVR